VSGTTVQAPGFETDFEAFLERSVVPGWVRDLRLEGMQHFRELGLPRPKDEDWLYTNVRPLAGGAFPPARASEHPPTSLAAHRFALGLERSARIVFLNGRFEASLSDVAALPAGAELRSFWSLQDTEGALRREGFATVADMTRHPFVALNTAFIADGALLRLAPGVTVEDPIQILYLHTPSSRPVAVHPRVLVLAGEGSRCTYVERYGIDCIGALAGGTCLTNAVAEVRLEPGADVRAVRVQREGTRTYHIGFTAVRQDRDSRFALTSISLGGALDRHQVHVDLDAPGAECVLNGLYVISDDEHCDNHTVVEHRVPHGRSAQLFKGILGGAARGAFTGRVIVHPNAQKTVATQANHNLLLSDDAVAETRPQLEIRADDVKCAHGATIGRLDEDALHYLRSRGIGPRTARNLLVHAFASEITHAVGDERIAAGLDALLASRLEGPPREETS
jgi:Fe-S cluster assembly protein SufD